MSSGILSRYLSDKQSISTKEKIIYSAMSCFKTKGYHQATTREIAEKSGIKNASLFYFFDTKEELAITVIKELTQLTERHLTNNKQEFNRRLEAFKQDCHTTCLPLGLLFELPQAPNLQAAARDYFKLWHRLFKENSNLNQKAAENMTWRFFNFLLLKRFWPDCSTNLLKSGSISESMGS